MSIDSLFNAGHFRFIFSYLGNHGRFPTPAGVAGQAPELLRATNSPSQ